LRLLRRRAMNVHTHSVRERQRTGKRRLS
jgi:hypothetical protein